MSKRDYYEVLGVRKDSTLEEIKKSYRKKAMEFHPDRNKSPGAEEKFKEINESYEVLSNEQKRKSYDMYGHNGPQQSFGGYSQSQGFGGFSDLGSIFEDFFGGFARGANFPKKGANLRTVITITFQEAFEGKKTKVKIPNKEIKEINIPPGVVNGTELRLRGYGQKGINKGPNGDLIIKIIIQDYEKSNFSIKGIDLFHTIKIDYFDLMIKKEHKILLPNKENITFTIPEFSDPKKLIRMKEKGFVSLNKKSVGDLFIKIDLVMPKKVNKKTKQDLLKIIEKIK